MICSCSSHICVVKSVCRYLRWMMGGGGVVGQRFHIKSLSDDYNQSPFNGSYISLYEQKLENKEVTLIFDSPYIQYNVINVVVYFLLLFLYFNWIKVFNTCCKLLDKGSNS